MASNRRYNPTLQNETRPADYETRVLIRLIGVLQEITTTEVVERAIKAYCHVIKLPETLAMLMPEGPEAHMNDTPMKPRLLGALRSVTSMGHAGRPDGLMKVLIEEHKAKQEAKNGGQ